MSELRLVTSAAEERLDALTLSFGKGQSSLVSDDAETLLRVAEMLVGLRQPRRGAAWLDAAALHAEPAARARVVSLLRDETLPRATSVEGSLTLAFALRGSKASPAACLAAFGLTRWLELSPTALAAQELRAVVFALSVACADVARAAVFYDPFALAPLISTRAVLAACQRLAEEHIVVTLVPELEHAVRLGGHCTLLQRGRVAPYGALAAGPPLTLSLRSPQASELAALLSSNAAVQHVEVVGGELRVSTANAITLSREITRLALDHRIELSGLALPSSSLSEQLWLRTQGEAR